MPVKFDDPKFKGNVSRAIKAFEGRINYLTQKVDFLNDPEVPLDDKKLCIEADFKNKSDFIENLEKILLGHFDELLSQANRNALPTLAEMNSRDMVSQSHREIETEDNNKVSRFTRYARIFINKYESYLQKLKDVQSSAHSNSDFSKVSHNIDDVYDLFRLFYYFNKFHDPLANSNEDVLIHEIMGSLEDFCNDSYSDFRKVVNEWSAEKHTRLDALQSFIDKQCEFMRRNIRKYSNKNDQHSRNSRIKQLKIDCTANTYALAANLKRSNSIIKTLEEAEQLRDPLFLKIRSMSAAIQTDKEARLERESRANSAEFLNLWVTEKHPPPKTTRKKSKKKKNRNNHSRITDISHKDQRSADPHTSTPPIREATSCATDAEQGKEPIDVRDSSNSSKNEIQAVVSMRNVSSENINELPINSGQEKHNTTIAESSEDKDHEQRLNPNASVEISLPASPFAFFPKRDTIQEQKNSASPFELIKGQRRNLVELFDNASFRFKKFRNFIKGLPGASIKPIGRGGSHFIVELPNVATGETDIGFVDSDHIVTTKGTVIRPHGKGSSEKLQGYYHDLAISCLEKAGITPANFPVLEVSLDKREDGMIPHPAAGFLPN